MLINLKLRGRKIGTVYGEIKFDEQGISDDLSVEEQKKLGELPDFEFVEEDTPREDVEEEAKEIEKDLKLNDEWEEQDETWEEGKAEREVPSTKEDEESAEPDYGSLEKKKKEELQEIGRKVDLELPDSMVKKDMIAEIEAKLEEEK